jgi:hypothetical protein
MWIFTKDGYFSIVQKGGAPNTLMVRARVRPDLEILADKLHLGPAAIIDTPDGDYAHRLLVDKEAFARYLANSVHSLDYPNFKATVNHPDHLRHRAYMRVWESLFNWQHVFKKRGSSTHGAKD